MTTGIKVVIGSAVGFFASMFVMGIWYNKWTTLVFYLMLLVFVVSVFVEMFKLPVSESFEYKYRQAKTGTHRFGIISVAFLCIFGLVIGGMDWLVHVIYLFK